MATLSKGYTFGATESVTNTKLHNLVDLGAISDIVDADISATADIGATKLDLASAGYLTTGGSFDVTGQYSFNDLSWFNLGSLASINSVRIQSGMITSLMSISDARIKDATLDTTVIGSLASIGQLNLANPLNYVGIVSSLASGSIPMYNGSNNFVGLEKPDSLSNVVFMYSGLDSDDAQGTDDGEITHSSITTSATGNYRYLRMQNTSLTTILTSRYVHQSGISTLTIHAKIWNGQSDAETGTIRVDVGGQNSSVTTVSSNTPTWKTNTISVVSLTPGTTYTITISGSNTDASSHVNCSKLLLIAS